jgi:hypothetical protein
MRLMQLSGFRVILWRAGISLLAAIISALLVYLSGNFGPTLGVLTLLALAGLLGSLILMFQSIVVLLAQAAGRSIKPWPFWNFLLVLGSVTICLLSLEMLLGVQVAQKPKDKGATPVVAPLIIPDHWAKRPVIVPGANRAYYWHGHLHVFDVNNFRRTTPFPAKQRDIFRIIIFGDSFTYGQGVAEESAYPRVLERTLLREYRVEVLNLGIDGYQSEDILMALKKFAPSLQPDLVVYGICLNDFLPSGLSATQVQTAYAIPLAEGIKGFLIKNIYSLTFLSEQYDRLLRRFHLRRSFESEVSENFPKYRVRFGADLKAMQAFAIAQKFGPIVAITLDNWPRYMEGSHRKFLVAQELAAQAGMRVVKTEQFYRDYDKEGMGVSQWEAHPNEKAQRIFAELLAEEIKKTPSLELYRK